MKDHADDAGRDDDEHDGIRTETSKTAGEGGDLVQPVTGDDEVGKGGGTDADDSCDS